MPTDRHLRYLWVQEHTYEIYFKYLCKCRISWGVVLLNIVNTSFNNLHITYNGYPCTLYREGGYELYFCENTKILDLFFSLVIRLYDTGLNLIFLMKKLSKCDKKEYYTTSVKYRNIYTYVLEPMYRQQHHYKNNFITNIFQQANTKQLWTEKKY